MSELIGYEESKRILEEEGVPTEYLEKVIEKHYEKKAKLFELLGLNEGNNFRKSFTLTTSVANRPLANRVLEDITHLTDEYKSCDMVYMWEGKNKVKVSKIFAEVIPIAIQAVRDQRCGKDVKWIPCGILDLFDEAGLSMTHFEIDFKKALQSLNCFYGDYIKPNRTAWISGNAYDYFTLSGKGCSFTSCIRIGGEYFNSCLAYLNSDCMMPLYVTTADNPSKKIGRCCGYISNDMIMTGRAFGSMFDTDSQEIRNFIEDILGGSWRKVSGGISQSKVINASSAYIDWGCGQIAVRNGANYNNLDFTIPCGYCLSCGQVMDSDAENNGVCCLCQGETCDNCGDHSNNLYSINHGETCYCPECADEHATICNQCGGYFTGDYIRRINPNLASEECICDSCRRRMVSAHGYFVRCDKCDGEFSRCNTVPIEDTGEMICKNCLDEACHDYHQCDQCLCYYKTTINQDGKEFCPECNDIYLDKKAEQEKAEREYAHEESISNTI